MSTFQQKISFPLWWLPPPLIKQDIAGFSGNLAGIYAGDLAVVKFIPAFVYWVLCKCSVMPSVQGAVVIAHSVQVVHQLISTAITTLQYIIGKVETLYWEINEFLDFSRTENWGTLVRETLQVDYQEFWCTIKFHFLKCILMFFTSRTVPFIIAC